MEFQYKEAPVAAEQFRFSVSGADSPIRILATIHGKPVFEGECPDPPCHEQMLIPRDAGGADLYVRLTARGQQVLERKIGIGKREEGEGGQFMTAD